MVDFKIMISIVTWNVNSIRAREERILAWLKKHDPDILLLQETKVQDVDFPKVFEDQNYYVAIHGQKSYNGVAIISKFPLNNVVMGFNDSGNDEQARAITATVKGICVMSVYVPNGREVGHPYYDFKLEWLKRFFSYIEKNDLFTKDFVVGGDFNVAMTDLDVYDPVLWKDRNICTTIERDTLGQIKKDTNTYQGLTDLFRYHYPNKTEAYSWWDYRSLGFPKNKGLRIDHIYGSTTMRDRSKDVIIDRDERKGSGPSDHVPVMAVFNE